MKNHYCYWTLVVLFSFLQHSDSLSSSNFEHRDAFGNDSTTASAMSPFRSKRQPYIGGYPGGIATPAAYGYGAPGMIAQPYAAAAAAGYCPPNCFQCNRPQCRMYQCIPSVVNCCCLQAKPFDLKSLKFLFISTENSTFGSFLSVLCQNLSSFFSEFIFKYLCFFCGILFFYF